MYTIVSKSLVIKYGRVTALVMLVGYYYSDFLSWPLLFVVVALIAGWSSASAKSNEPPPAGPLNNTDKTPDKNKTKQEEQQHPKESVRDSGYCVHLGGAETGESEDEEGGPEDEGLQKVPRKQDSVEQEQEVNRFNQKQKKGFIDVWWLFDDGGQ